MATKLELTWIGKEEEIKIEPRILVETPELSNTNRKTSIQQTLFDDQTDMENMLIHGDNLLALKALETKFSGKVKCIYIDPPYNTGSAFEHYDDNLEHSIWLNLMRDRLKILRNLLSDDGLIFVQIDDNELAYLKVMMDEIFGRSCFVNCIVVKMSEASGIKMAHSEKRLPKLKEYILMYKKDTVQLNEFKIPKQQWDDEYKSMIIGITKEELEYVKQLVKVEDRTDEQVAKCRSILHRASYTTLATYFRENNIRGQAEQTDFCFNNAYRIFQTVSMGGGTTQAINDSRETYCENIFFPHITSQNKMYIIKGDYDLSMRKPRIQVLFADEYLTYNPCDLWTDIKTTGLDNEGAGIAFKNSKKPETLISRILTIASKEGDLVLDSFLGSGTTAAVAHKMKRRWIGIELGNHAYTHCKARLDKVIEGEQGGISKAVGWHGGGGYRFYELAPSLIVEDRFGNPIINKNYNADMLAAAMALHEGFVYSPDTNYYWKQGKNENAYIFTTTSHITADYLSSIATEMKDGEYLLIACKTYDDGIEKQFKNITIKKIPQVLLGKCEFGVDNYNLNIVDVPSVDEETD